MPSTLNLSKLYTTDQLREINDRVFGKSEVRSAPKQLSPSEVAYNERNTVFQDMLNFRKQEAEQARTDSVKMARYNALGNLLTSLVQPIGWGIGGGKGATAGVQPYDNRAYIDAFNRAVKATDDLRSIGTKESEYKFQLADEKYRRELALEDEARKRRQRQEDLEAEEARYAKRKELAHGYTMDEIEARGDVQKWLAEYKATHRITPRGGLSVDDRILIKQKGEYEELKRSLMNRGIKPPTFEEYMDGEGYDIVQNQNVAPAPASSSSSTPKNTKTTKTTTPAGNSGRVTFNVNGAHGSVAGNSTNNGGKAGVTLRR